MKHRKKKKEQKTKVAKKPSKTAATPNADVLLPVGARAARAALGADVLHGDAWFSGMLRETKTAASWVAASRVFDDEETVRVLLKKLRSPGGFECKVVVDERAHRDNVSRYRRPRLRALRAAGAEVYLAGGSNQSATRRFGRSARGPCMHAKAVVIDSRVAYAGYANCTQQARVNRELMLRLVGPPVTDVLSGVSSAIANATCGDL